MLNELKNAEFLTVYAIKMKLVIHHAEQYM